MRMASGASDSPTFGSCCRAACPAGSKNPRRGRRAIEAAMPSRLRVVLGIGLWVSAAGCATSAEW
jgi:hypothetical protein